MFYSHEVLTDRKYGVATVWLVATLGSRSSLKRITRKQLLDVDVAKACKTIVDPVVPMALRLQSKLLYGVSRVYLQQCGYVLADAQSAQNIMVLMLRSVRNHALDPDAGKARPDQLILQDDPSFLPEFAPPPPELLADLDLAFKVNFSHSDESQSLTPFGSQHSSRSSHVAGYDLVLPSSSPNRPACVGLEGESGDQDNTNMRDNDNFLQLDEPDFMFGEDGDIIELTPGLRAHAAPATPIAGGGEPAHTGAGASARVRQEYKDGQRSGVQVFTGDQTDMDLPVYGNKLSHVEATLSVVNQQPSEHIEIIGSSSSFAAPLRRKKRTARALPKDTRLELRNSELLSWNTDYLKNMKEAVRSKVQHRIQQQAKKNAEHYVWGAGIGGLGRDPFGAQGPLNRFMGDSLFELLTGTSRNPKAATKRDRDSGIDEATQEEALRKRQKIAEPEEISRGQDDEDPFFLGGDKEVELPREAVSALDDQQIFSAMPWNISASKRGSSAIPLSGRITIVSEQGRQGNRAGSRIVSASPLLRRSTGRPGDFEALQSLDSDALGGDDFAFAAATSDSTDYMEVNTQPSLRVREALSAEGENFFAFVADAITRKCSRALADMTEMPDADQFGATELEQVTFEELLPPSETSKMVACQAFLMLLSLGKKGMLDVQQPEAFNYITLKLTDKAKAMQIIEREDFDRAEPRSDQNMEDVPVEVGAGDNREVSELQHNHFQEQMAAKHATTGDNDDHDSLYDSH